jgi:undecaprenyl diphosphate synthase
MENIKHVAFIMDGNGRWANERNLPRHLGHKEGVENVNTIIDECYDLSIFCVSFYCFSTENWNRPKREINHLFNYLESFFKKNIKKMIKKQIRMHVSGDISKLPVKTQNIINECLTLTKDYNKMIVNFCLNYGGRDEIIRGIKKIYNSDFDINNLNEENFKLFLDTSILPDVDLLVRTSGEERISNFLLYELAYAEFIFNQKYWPEYSIDDLHQDLEKFKSRNRRFGGLNNGR